VAHTYNPSYLGPQEGQQQPLSLTGGLICAHGLPGQTVPLVTQGTWLSQVSWGMLHRRLYGQSPGCRSREGRAGSVATTTATSQS
jgi:hypothetical protein